MAVLATGGREAVRLALGSARSEDLIEGGKAAVVRELETLDPTVRIKTTDYFNHTFAPDLELAWPGRARIDTQQTNGEFCARLVFPAEGTGD